MKNLKYFLNEEISYKNKIVLIRKKYIKEYKNLEKLGSSIFEYIWTDDKDSLEKIKNLKDRLIWYRGPIENIEWQELMKSVQQNNTVMNDPQKCLKVASKSKFYKDNLDFKFLPKVWFKPEDAEFPCVEKPDNSFSGKGVRVVKNIKDVDTENGDVWMEKIDFESEWRVWVFKDTLLGTFWRKHIKNIENKKSDEKVDFEYIEKEIPSNTEDLETILKYCYDTYKLEFSAIDLFYKDDKWYLCEVNSQPGYLEPVWKRLISTLKKYKNEITKSN